MSKHTLRKSACTLALLLSCLAFGFGSAFGQSQTFGAIGGVVKDPQGAILQNANVTVKNEETNKEMSGTTDSEGRFRIPQLDPGNYTVTVNATGFAAFTQQKVVVEVGRITPLDINLTVGGATSGPGLTTRDARLNGHPHHPGPVTGHPILDDALASLECRTYATHPGGDHTILVGQVLSVTGPPAGAEPPGPLLYHDGRYRRLPTR